MEVCIFMYCVKIKIETGLNNIERYTNALLSRKNQEDLRLRSLKDDTMVFTRRNITEKGRQIIIQGSSKHYATIEEFVKTKRKIMENKRNNRWRIIGTYSFEKRKETIYLLFLERHC